jgi:hypothetical protein
VVYFDDVRFEGTAAPPAGGDSDGEQQIRSAPEDGGDTATGNAQQVASAETLTIWTGPADLVNVREELKQPATLADSGGRPLWPLLLAFGVPAASLTVMAGSAWRRARLAERNERHL